MQFYRNHRELPAGPAQPESCHRTLPRTAECSTTTQLGGITFGGPGGDAPGAGCRGRRGPLRNTIFAQCPSIPTQLVDNSVAPAQDAAVQMAQGCPVLQGGGRIMVFETFDVM
jgi:hypothetical protein